MFVSQNITHDLILYVNCI